MSRSHGVAHRIARALDLPSEQAKQVISVAARECELNEASAREVAQWRCFRERTLLMEACRKNRAELIDVLMSVRGISPFVVDDGGESALHYAVEDETLSELLLGTLMRCETLSLFYAFVNHHFDVDLQGDNNRHDFSLNANIIRERVKRAKSPLESAVVLRQMDRVRNLVQCGAEFHGRVQDKAAKLHRGDMLMYFVNDGVEDYRNALRFVWDLRTEDIREALLERTASDELVSHTIAEFCVGERLDREQVSEARCALRVMQRSA
ncbi:MAG: hypothetical protein MHM6MM_004993 [Cercozoa sp. M6MM]